MILVASALIAAFLLVLATEPEFLNAMRPPALQMSRASIRLLSCLILAGVALFVATHVQQLLK